MPSQQEIINWAETLRVFNDVTIPALYGFLFFVFLLVGAYFLRGTFGSSKRRDENNSQMLQLIAGMQSASTERQAQIDRFAIQIEKSDDLSRAALAGVQAAMTALATSNENQTTNIRALIGRTDTSVALLQGVASSIGERASAASVESLTRLVNEINAYICEAIPRLATKSEFDEAIGRLETVQKVTQDAIRECVEKKKIVTDENPIVTLPDISPAVPSEEKKIG
jgi:hypothetical protein